ncbi:TauD/TfdA family dioxygenase [Aliiroseovarius sp.]|uniref:TauD/TfdA family dioxygenase n=1 Tax=Aliiroseovarius sp. TaxID=1872442 RepID=UPI003BAC0E84
MTDLPWTPDFDSWPITHGAMATTHTGDVLSVTWSDGATSQYHALLLRENSADPATIHPKAREMCLSPCAIPPELEICAAGVEDNGAIWVRFSDATRSAFHPGWLRGIAWFGEEQPPAPVLWRGEDQPEPPSFDGPEALSDPAVFLQWLEALRDYGVARLRGLPQEDGLLERIVTRIGPVRESNFGRQYTLEIKDDPDSQAFTSDMLLQHIDLPTRETPHGLQFLYTRDNTTTGGEGLYADAYRIAEDMRLEEPAHFHSLVTDVWEYSNRARGSDYRGWGPVVETDPAGHITGIRYNTFLRAPLKAPVHVQRRAYKAYRAFCARAQDARYLMAFRYAPGDLLAFDNRRALHGRAGYEAKGGTRFIEGIYADRDDLQSRIRTLRRQMRAEAEAGAGVGA